MPMVELEFDVLDSFRIGRRVGCDLEKIAYFIIDHCC
jgi:hypothetical protein